MKNKIKVELYANEYSDHDVVQSIIDGNIGVEVSFESSTERSRKIISFEDAVCLKDGLEKTLKKYEAYKKIYVQASKN